MPVLWTATPSPRPFFRGCRRAGRRGTARTSAHRQAHTLAATAHPELAFARQQADQADQAADTATRAHHAATWNLLRGGIDSPRDAQAHDRADQHSADRARDALQAVQAEIGALTGEPVIRALRPGRLDLERNLWQAERSLDSMPAQEMGSTAATVSHEPAVVHPPAPTPGISI